MTLLKGNKGEWSELYAFVRLLSTGKLYAADENVCRQGNFYFSILNIFRNEFPEIYSKYKIDSQSLKVEIYINDKKVSSLKMSELCQQADLLLHEIKQGSASAFAIPEADLIMKELYCCKIKAPSKDKADIVMELHDPNVGYNHSCGFSIKSDIGKPPTLLNASGATNFVYEVEGVSNEDAEVINKISCKDKIIKRIRMITKCGKMTFVKTNSPIFEGNLRLIDSMMPDIIGELVLYSYQQNEKNLLKISNYLETVNPLNGRFPQGFYSYKIKELLCAVALGMVPNHIWDGKDEANGGYIIVNVDGGVLAYHIYNRDAFKEYLLKNTVLERASTSKHNFAKIYKVNGKKYINLNLQIRFK